MTDPAEYGREFYLSRPPWNQPKPLTRTARTEYPKTMHTDAAKLDKIIEAMNTAQLKMTLRMMALNHPEEAIKGNRDRHSQPPLNP